jgi:hypothetical protein
MRGLRYLFALTSYFAYAQIALALDPLLVEFGWSQPDPVTLPANYTASVNSTPWNGAFGGQIISQYPTNEFAGPFAIDFWNQSCSFGTACGIAFANGGQQPAQLGGPYNLDQVLGGPNQSWADGWDGNTQPFVNHTGIWHTATYVPQKGNGNQALFGYQITAVEREVTATTQTIRLYGVDAPVPEPSTLVLALLGCAAISLRAI